MPWVTFLTDYDWPVPNAKSKTTIAYRAGTKVLVKQKCADDAEKAGAIAFPIGDHSYDMPLEYTEKPDPNLE